MTGREDASGASGRILPAIPGAFRQKWARVLRSAVEICRAAEARVTQVTPDGLVTLAASPSAAAAQPEPSERLAGCYEVMARRDILSSPGGEPNVLDYLGAPLVWPDGRTFGTICLFDVHRQDDVAHLRNLLLQLAELIQGDFRIIHYSRLLERQKATLEDEVDRRTSDIRTARDQLEKELKQRCLAESDLSWELRVSSTLADLSQSLIDPSQRIGDIATNVLAFARRLTESEHGFASEIDLNTGENVGHTLTAMFGKSCQITGPDKRITFPRGEDGTYGKLSGHALDTGESFIANVPSEHPKSGGVPKGHVPLRRFMAVPVKYGQEVVGEVALANAPEDYTPRHLEAVRRIADLFALAIHRNRNEKSRSQLEAQLRQTQKMEAIGTLAGGIAHDFNNILGAILGYTELVQLDEGMGARSREFLNEVLSATQRARGLVEQILTFSRKEREKTESIPVHRPIEEAARLLKQVIPKTVTVHTSIDRKTGSAVANGTQIYQIVMNIGTNAYQAMRETGGRLDICLEPVELGPDTLTRHPQLAAGRCAQLTIRDTGMGMDPETLARVFDPFFTTKAPGDGTGLGLSVVYGIVQSLGGAIEVDSEEGRGTTFRVLFPLESESTESAREEHADPAMGSEHVLVVDDEPALAELASRTLGTLGYRVTTTFASQMALEVFRANPQGFDLLLTDQTMPGMTGDVLAAEIMRIRPDLPVIICTGYSELLDEVRARELGIRKFLMKPLSRLKLSAAIREVLNSSE